MYCLKCSHVNIWDLGSSAWTVMRKVLTEQVSYLSYVMQINMHGQHMFWVCVDFCWLLKWTISLISKSLPSCSSRAHHHRPEQFKVYKHTDSFVNIDETYLLKYTYHVYPTETNVCLKSICLAYIENYVSKIPSSKIYCIFGYTKGANISVSSHIMNIGSSMIACCKALVLSFNLML